MFFSTLVALKSNKHITIELLRPKVGSRVVAKAEDVWHIAEVERVYENSDPAKVLYKVSFF